MRYLWICWLF